MTDDTVPNPAVRDLRWTRGLLSCGVAAGPVFVTAFVIQGVIRKGYLPSRHPVSSLALGPGGWVQTANFAVTGTLFLAAGAGLVGSALFATDPVSGYPPGTPDMAPTPSRAGRIHTLVAVPVFVGLPAAAFTCGWRSARLGRPGFARYSAATGVTMLVTPVLSGAGFGQSPQLVQHAGWFQRASITAGFTWLSALSLSALRGSGKGAATSLRANPAA